MLTVASNHIGKRSPPPAAPPTSSSSSSSCLQPELESVCGCDCGHDHDAEGPLDVVRIVLDRTMMLSVLVRCQCRLCGDPEEGYGCKSLITFSAAAKGLWVADSKGLHAVTEQALEEAPVFCERCRDHALLMSRQDAVRRMQQKRKLSTAQQSVSSDRKVVHQTGQEPFKLYYLCHTPTHHKLDECLLLSGAVGILNLTLLGPLFRKRSYREQ